MELALLDRLQGGGQIHMDDRIDYSDYRKALEFDRRVSRAGALNSLTRALIDELGTQPADRVLDVGTGTGRLGVTLSKTLAEGFVVGIDSGYGMLRVAGEKVLEHGLDSFHVVCGKAEALPFSASIFDAACLMLSFHHFTDPAKALGEIRQVLKAEGRLVSLDPVLEEPEDEEDSRLNEAIEEAFQLAHGPEFRFFTVLQLRRLYEGAGFTVEACMARDFSFDQVGFEGIPMGPHCRVAGGNCTPRPSQNRT